MSDELEQSFSQSNDTRLDTFGTVLECRARSGLAVGPVQGDDEVATSLSPVDLSHLGQELLDALIAAMGGIPGRSPRSSTRT